MKRSLKDRRELGWQVVHKAFQPAVVTNPGSGGKYVPSWLTWYTAEEIESMFGDLYVAIPTEQRNNKNATVPDEIVDCVMKKFSTRERVENWDGRFDMRRIEQLKGQSPESLNKIASQVTYFSPEYVKHFLKNYTQVINCKEVGDLNAEPSDTLSKFPCFSKPFPPDAVSIKAAWMHPENDVDFFDTTAKGMKTMTTTYKWENECVQLDGKETCKLKGGDSRLDGKVFTANVPHPNGKILKFRLVGLHVATKALPEWTWTSIWWSPTKDDDFGQGRPNYLGKYQNAQFPELQNYKMCNVVHWEEHDPTLLKIYNGEVEQKPGPRTLYGALASAYEFGAGLGDGDTALTYCSNPFIEKESDMVDSNCIGCHQAAGPGGDMEFTRGQIQKRFPADYAWSFTSAGTAFSTDDNFQRRFSLQYRDLFNEPHVACTTGN